MEWSEYNLLYIEWFNAMTIIKADRSRVDLRNILGIEYS